MGLGFTLALFLMGSVREILGSGTWFGLTIPGMVGHTMSLFVMPAGLLSGAGLCDCRGLRPVQKAAAEENRLCRMSNAASCRAKCEEATHEYLHCHYHCCRTDQ